MANRWLRQLLDEDEPQEQSANSDGNAVWEQGHPLSWADFLTLLSNYCQAPGWELLVDSPADGSCAIFAHDEGSDEALQEQLPFAEKLDALPF